MNTVNLAELTDFIFDASRATYASGDESMKRKLPDGSTTIEFEKGAYKYNDNYFGGEPYGGREVVIYQGKPVWMMVYYGFVYPGLVNKDVYAFLIESLSNSTPEIPYRGPRLFERNGWRYENELTGDVEKFSGIEKILKEGACVYEASYIGGLVDR